MNLQTHRLREQTYGCPWGRMQGKDSWGVGGGHVHTAIFKMKKPTGPTV